MKNLRSTSRRPELLLDLIALDRQSPEPLHRQLYLRLVELIMDGSLPFDGRLPSSRALAQKISVSRNTVVSAYQQLEVEGYVQAQRGSQTFVAAAPNRSTTHRIEEPKGTKDPLSKRGRQMISQPMNFFGLAHRRSLQPGISLTSRIFRSSPSGASSRIGFRRAAITYSATSTSQATHRSNGRLLAISPRRGACIASRTRW